jgi:hypothetical protein
VGASDIKSVGLDAAHVDVVDADDGQAGADSVNRDPGPDWLAGVIHSALANALAANGVVRWLVALSKPRLKLDQEAGLSLQNLATGFLERKPLTAIYFREFPILA